MSCAWALDAKPAPPVSPQSQKRKGNLQEKQLQEKKKKKTASFFHQTDPRRGARIVARGPSVSLSTRENVATKMAVWARLEKDGDVGKAVTSLFAHVDGLIRLF
jgi:hypothetical protein